MPGLSSPYGASLRRVSGVPIVATTTSMTMLANTIASDSDRQRSGEQARADRCQQCAGEEQRAETEHLGALHPPAHRAAVVIGAAVIASGAGDRRERGVVLGLDVVGKLRERLGLRERCVVGEEQRVLGEARGSSFSSSSCTPSTGET